MLGATLVFLYRSTDDPRIVRVILAPKPCNFRRVEKKKRAMPNVLGDGDVDDSTEAALEGSLHLRGAKVEAVREHGEGVAADPEPAEAEPKKDKGDDRRLEATRVTSLSARSSFSVTADLPVGASGGWTSWNRVLAWIFLQFVGFRLGPLSSTPLWKPTKKA